MILVLVAAALAFVFRNYSGRREISDASCSAKPDKKMLRPEQLLFFYFRGRSLALTTDSYFFQKESAAPLTSESHHTGFDGGTEA